VLIHVVETASFNNASCRKTNKQDMDKMRREGDRMEIGSKRSKKIVIRRYFNSNFCADTMHLKCGISLKRNRNESSHNAIGVGTERMELDKRVETVPPSHSLTKRARLESSPAHRHFTSR